MRIDLHAHSTASDGTLTPANLVRRAATLDVGVLALTDHDTTAGWAEAAQALPAGVRLVRGAEISCVHRGISLHLLGYLFDSTYPPLVAALQRLRDGREHRTERMLEALRADGYDLTVQADGTIGRPHVAQALVAAGLVGSIDEAFGPDWIGSHGRYWVGKTELDVLDAIALVREAGGVAVFAHPLARSRGRVVDDAAIEQLAAAGLAGLEVDHPDHTDDDRSHLRGLAGALDLAVTGASDFHGTNKRIELGAHSTGVPSYERLVAQATGVEVLSG